MFYQVSMNINRHLSVTARLMIYLSARSLRNSSRGLVSWVESDMLRTITSPLKISSSPMIIALGIPKAIIIGDGEILRGEVVVRNMSDSTQETKPLDEFLNDLSFS